MEINLALFVFGLKTEQISRQVFIRLFVAFTIRNVCYVYKDYLRNEYKMVGLNYKNVRQSGFPFFLRN